MPDSHTHNDTPEKDPRTNPDPITGEPGSHPVGTGIGAATAGAVGAAVGAVGGPVGAVIGAAVGGIAGGLAGKGLAEMMDPTVEEAYWRENHSKQPYSKEDRPYEDYSPAYQTGYMGYQEGKTFEEREADLRLQYEGGPQRTHEQETNREENAARSSGSSTAGMSWEEAREAARAAYNRVGSGQARPSHSGNPPKQN